MANPTTSMSLSDMFRDATGIRRLTEPEKYAINSVADGEGYMQATENNDMGFLHLYFTEESTAADGTTTPRMALTPGMVLGFPRDPSFAWSSWPTSSWHMYEIMSTAGEDYVLASCGSVGGGDAGTTAGCFEHPTEDRLSLPFLPPAVVLMRDPTNFARARRTREAAKDIAREPEGRKRGSREPPGKRGRSVVWGEEDDELEDGDGERREGRSGLRTDVDDDGHVRVYRSAASAAYMSGMRAIFRTTSDIKRGILTVGEELDDVTWVAAMDCYVGREAPEDLEPEMATLYLFSMIKDAKVVTDPTIAAAARRMTWVKNNWSVMTIMYFLANPAEEKAAQLAGSTDTHGRRLLASAVEGWILFQTTHRDSRYENRMADTIAWLRKPSFKKVDKNDGLRLRHLLEELFYRYSTAIKSGGRATQYPGVNFGDKDAHLRLLDAMEKELLTETVYDDPYPHPHFQDWCSRHTVPGMPQSRKQPLPTASAPPPPPNPPTKTSQPSAATPGPKTGAAPAIRTQAATVLAPDPEQSSSAESKEVYVVCAWYVAGLLHCTDSSNVERGCHFSQATTRQCRQPHCPLSSLSASAVKASCMEQLGSSVLSKRVGEAIDLNPGMFR